MTNNEIKTVLVKFANSDIRLARKHGEITIAQTKRGNVTLAASGSDLTVSGADVNYSTGEIKSWSITGAVGFVRETLCNLYTVAV